jgi:plasmid stability protein
LINRGHAVTTITVRRLGKQAMARLRMRAARHGRSIADEARATLRAALASESAPAPNLAEAIRRRFRPLGGVDLQLPARGPIHVVKRRSG